jgi:hypothetical protein
MREPQNKAAKIARSLAPLTLLGVLAAAAFGVSAVDLRTHRAPFKLSAKPERRAVFAGQHARYRITIDRRHHFRGRVAIRVGGLPPHTGARVVRPSRVLAKVTVVTKPSARPGSYRLRVHGSSGRVSVLIRVTLKVLRPRAARFTLAGNARPPLWPGVVDPVNVVVHNRNGRAILVWKLAMHVQKIHAPRATHIHPCGRADFSVKQYRGSYPLLIPHRATRTLKQLNIARRRWPRVAMLNRPLDQDGCQGATITLSYGGSARTR